MKRQVQTVSVKSPTISRANESVVFLRGKKTILRPVSISDIPLLTKWINDPDTRQFVECFLPMTEEAEKEWYASLQKRSETSIILVIEVKSKPIGTMGIHNIKWKDGVGMTGALIGEAVYRSKGYGTDAKMALLDYAFNTLNLRKISSTVKAFNGRSLAYMEKCGYKQEGCLRQHSFENGQYWDHVILGLFKGDWLPLWEAYNRK